MLATRNVTMAKGVFEHDGCVLDGDEIPPQKALLTIAMLNS